MEIKELKKKDFRKAIQYTIVGMHFEEYLKNKFFLNAYGRYFWYLEYTNATQVIAAYEGDELLGVLLADIKGEKKPYKSFGKELYVKFINIIQNLFFGGIIPYNEANRKMFDKYTEHYTPDGELRFLAANPKSKAKGIGTFLLNELVRRESGKEIYLYTDANCTYQFYEHRGFERVGEQRIVFEPSGGGDLKCFLYRRKL